jgi:hypothetical protein
MTTKTNTRTTGLPFADYAAIEATNASAIKAGQLSMLHMHHRLTGPDKPETPAMQMGRLVHAAVLEPEITLSLLEVWTGKARRGKAWDEFCEVHESRIIVTQDQSDKLEAMTAAVHANKDAHDLIEATEHEVTYQWDGKRYGPAKARLDGHSKAAGVLEYKTTTGIGLRQFTTNAYRMGYHIGIGWYCHGAEEVDGGGIPQAHFIVQEQDAPHDCYVLRVSRQIIEAGRDETCEIARRYYVHKHVGSFPGVACGEILDYEIPAWAGGGDSWTVE